MKEEELTRTIVVPPSPRFKPSPELEKIEKATHGKLNEKAIKELEKYISSVQSKREV